MPILAEGLWHRDFSTKKITIEKKIRLFNKQNKTAGSKGRGSGSMVDAMKDGSMKS